MAEFVHSFTQSFEFEFIESEVNKTNEIKRRETRNLFNVYVEKISIWKKQFLCSSDEQNTEPANGKPPRFRAMESAARTNSKNWQQTMNSHGKVQH